MSFSEYWKAKAAKRRKKWASRDKRFADNHSQMEEIRKEVYTKLNPYDYHQYIETHYAKQNPIAVREQMQFHFSESGYIGLTTDTLFLAASCLFSRFSLLVVRLTQKSKIYKFEVDLFGHLSEIVFKYSILAK